MSIITYQSQSRDPGRRTILVPIYTFLGIHKYQSHSYTKLRNTATEAIAYFAAFVTPHSKYVVVNLNFEDYASRHEHADSSILTYNWTHLKPQMIVLTLQIGTHHLQQIPPFLHEICQNKWNENFSRTWSTLWPATFYSRVETGVFPF
jgi:hypothetical protein